MRGLREELRSSLAELRSEIRALRAEFRGELAAVRRDGMIATTAIVAAIVGTGVLS
jgi:hypothetical protein